MPEATIPPPPVSEPGAPVERELPDDDFLPPARRYGNYRPSNTSTDRMIYPLIPSSAPLDIQFASRFEGNREPFELNWNITQHYMYCAFRLIRLGADTFHFSSRANCNNKRFGDDSA